MTAQLWITLAAAVLGSGGLTAIITYFLTERTERKKRTAANASRETAMCDAVMLLTLDSLQERCRRVIDRDGRTDAETQQIIRQYSTYKALNGDGWADELYSAAIKTPLSPNSQKNNREE